LTRNIQPTGVVALVMQRDWHAGLLAARQSRDRADRAPGVDLPEARIFQRFRLGT
jgi:hypothetical protein